MISHFVCIYICTNIHNCTIYARIVTIISDHLKCFGDISYTVTLSQLLYFNIYTYIMVVGTMQTQKQCKIMQCDLKKGI
ncbi:hypothetical protein FKM82_023423 [Ascaphus truei]